MDVYQFDYPFAGDLGVQGMSIPPRIAVSPEQIKMIVSEFYSRVRSNPTLGPIFANHIADWPAHEEKIAGFWRNALLYERAYDGNPMQVHKRAGDVKAQHFPIWLKIFDEVLEELLPQDLGQQWSALAHRIGRGLQLGLGPAEDLNGVPNLKG